MKYANRQRTWRWVTEIDMAKKISKELNNFLFQCPECGRQGKMVENSFHDSWQHGKYIAWVTMKCKHPVCGHAWIVSLGKA